MCEKVNRLVSQFGEAGAGSVKFVAEVLTGILRDNAGKIDLGTILGTSFNSRDQINSASLIPVVANMSEGRRASVVAELGRRLG